MIKKLAWNTFKNTGNINTFLEFLECENAEKNLLADSGRNNIQNIPNDTLNQPNNVSNIYSNNSMINDEIKKRTN